MEKLDVDALLEKNPSLDKDLIKERQKKVGKGQQREPRRKGGVASPYGRRSGERGKWGDAADPIYRPHYRGV